MEKRHKDVGLYFSNLYIHAFHTTFHQEHYKGVYLKTDLWTDSVSMKNVVQPKCAGQTNI